MRTLLGIAGVASSVFSRGMTIYSKMFFKSHLNAKRDDEEEVIEAGRLFHNSAP